MKEQPEALRLANSTHLAYRVGWQREAAAELRRLSIENEAFGLHLSERMKDLARVEAQRDALLEAYRKMKNVAAGYSNLCDYSASTSKLEREFEAADAIARAAIDKAEGA